MTTVLKDKINTYIKNKIDISELVKDVDLRNVNLNRAIIKKLQRKDIDISGCSFAYCELGDVNSEDNAVSFISCKMHGCSFEGAKFLNKARIRSCDAQKCNFKNCDVSKVSYANSNFMDSKFCGAIIKIESKLGLGCKFPVEIFDELTRDWKLKLKAEYTD
jgi:uncharacterized protein YjbI with pentapeptide repeats